MSEQNEQNSERITADPVPENTDTKKKDKDPKKVAAGKKLAEYNKKAKEALAREMKREEKIKQEEESNENTYSEAKSWLPEISFTTVLSVVGLGFTAIDLFMRYKEKARTEYSNRIADLSQVPQTPQPKKIPFSATPKSLGME